MVVDTTRGKKLARKIRKIAGGSPIPNQSMAIGIHARGDIGRKNWIMGFISKRATFRRPSSIPRGMPRMAAKENPDSADTWIRLGNIYFDTARHQLAIEAYEKSLALAPNNANVLTDLGVMYRRSDRPNEAIASFDRAIAVNPKHETARFNKGIVLLHDLGDEKGAIKAWENLVEVNPVAVTPSGISVDEMVTEMKKQAGKTDG